MFGATDAAVTPVPATFMSKLILYQATPTTQLIRTRRAGDRIPSRTRRRLLPGLAVIPVAIALVLLSLRVEATSAETSAETSVQGDPICWGFGLTYEKCCLPRPEVNPCWDSDFTPQRCCRTERMGGNASGNSAIEKLREEIFTNVNPYSFLDHACAHPYKAQIERYPDSHLTHEIVRTVMDVFGSAPPKLWVEVGSFLGNSAITTAETLKALNASTGIVCIDPFTGMWSMWSYRKQFRDHFSLGRRESQTVADGMLLMDEFGHSRIYEVFLANIRASGHEDIVMPIRISSISGLRLLRKLHEQGRTDTLPQVIYLDSAHEPNETLLEIRDAWTTLQAPGLVFGDDWSWPGVRQDVSTFAREADLPPIPVKELHRFDWPEKEAEQPIPGLVVVRKDDGVWYLLKGIALGELA